MMKKITRGKSVRSEKTKKRSEDDCEKILVKLGSKWCSYPKDVTDALRAAYLKGHDKLKFKMYVSVKHVKHSNQRYRVNFCTMHQVNLYSGKTRQIKFLSKHDRLTTHQEPHEVMEGHLAGEVDILEDGDDDGCKSVVTDDARSMMTTGSRFTSAQRNLEDADTGEKDSRGTKQLELDSGYSGSPTSTPRKKRSGEFGHVGKTRRTITEILKWDPMLPKYRKSEAGAKIFFGKGLHEDVALIKERRSKLFDLLGEGRFELNEQDTRSKIKEVDLQTRGVHWSEFDAESLAAIHHQLVELDMVARKNGIPQQERSVVVKLIRRLRCTIRLMTGNILVFCRARLAPPPASQNFIVSRDGTRIQPIEVNGAVHKYTFDAVFVDETQEELFEEARCLFATAHLGNTISIFATGRSQTGKTFTMYGSQKRPGVVPRAVEAIFDCARDKAEEYTTRITCSMLELYMSTLVDLLRRDDDGVALPLSIAKNPTNGQIFVNNAVHDEVRNVKDFNKVMEKGFVKRKTIAVGSSRMSHLILRLDAYFKNKNTGGETHSKFFLVDMAGSESAVDSNGDAKVLNIQESMNALLTMFSTLGPTDDSPDAISAKERLSMCRKHILTEILSDAFGYRAKGILFANVANDPAKQEDYFRTLRYAATASRLKQPQED